MNTLRQRKGIAKLPQELYDEITAYAVNGRGWYSHSRLFALKALRQNKSWIPRGLAQLAGSEHRLAVQHIYITDALGKGYPEAGAQAREMEARALDEIPRILSVREVCERKDAFGADRGRPSSPPAAPAAEIRMAGHKTDRGPASVLVRRRLRSETDNV
ncbi:uncharacterized protein DSM5745_02323 [Aspergillus mulundensis]|uniref:Uncharacterized protein n=1 Tax=Aspergillus mulundensis TaxID=1810919 RepID=A0A3D8SXQ2_9EURO|nr:hypothetical protein DSM5745_02323 [Aspergillus mulundensis]RDW90548.1 hypothetical protein DSM5745_02323 [Aspergillus mulundensis]